MAAIVVSLACQVVSAAGVAKNGRRQFIVDSSSGSAPNDTASLRGATRNLAGYAGYEINSDQLVGAEVGFIVGAVVMLFVLVCLCRCCFRSRGISLCDILTCFCLWEICCDDGRVGDFVLL